MTSWKTTLAGILSAAGLFFSNSQDPTQHLIGTIAAAIGTFLIGATARDNDKSSEQVGIKP